MSVRPGTEALSAADASNVAMDAPDQVNVFLMAGLLGVGGFVLPGGATNLDTLRDVISGRLGDAASTGLRRFAQRLGGTSREPVWEACVPDLAWHIREVDRVVGVNGLAGLCASLMTTPLPTDRALWELLIVPGATEVGTGVVLRIHHAVADGVTGVRLVQLLFDQALQPVPPLGEPVETPRPVKPLVEPVETRPRPSALRRWWVGLIRMSAMFSTRLGPTVLLGPISARRGIAFSDVSIADLARGSRTAGGTINDALLAAVSAATSATLRAVGERVPSELPASIPVALPDRGTSGNAMGVMVIQLPLAEPDVAVRIARIAGTTRAAKAEAREQGTYEFTRSRWGTRAFAFLARRQRFVALFVTNVRGPERALCLAGAPLERAWPVSPIQGNVRFGIAAMSYAGRFDCVAHVDASAIDVAAVGSALREELDRICDLAPSTAPVLDRPVDPSSAAVQRNTPVPTL
ncbi:MAG: wax ester/triacylglycerol synthase domain-containing protein [Propionicimonas sp.]